MNSSSTIFPGSVPSGFVVSPQQPVAPPQPSTALHVGDVPIGTHELLPLLVRYRMLPQMVREVLIDRAIAEVELDVEAETEAYREFLNRQQLGRDRALDEWLERHGLTAAQFRALATRDRRIDLYKEKTFGPKLESYFLKRKSKLDRVVYSLLRCREATVAQELYFRIQAGEQSFAEVAREYSQGPEAQTGGTIGPVELSTPHPALAQRLSVSHPNQLWPPIRLEDWFIIVRLEKVIPAQLDDNVRRRLLDEMFSTWLQEQLNAQDISVRALGAATETFTPQTSNSESNA